MNFSSNMYNIVDIITIKSPLASWYDYFLSMICYVKSLWTCDQFWEGLYIQFANGPISWQSKKQKTGALSSVEVEYILVANATKEIIWIRHSLSKIHFTQRLPILIYCDNQFCLALTKNQQFSNHSKHIKIWYHFLWEKIKKNEINFEFTHQNILDFFR